VRFLRVLAVLVLVAILAAAGGWFYFDWRVKQPLALAADRLEVEIRPGSGVRNVVRQMVDGGVQLPAWLFEARARMQGKANALRAGTYEITRGMTTQQLLDKLVRGEVVLVEVRVLEGWTFRQIRKALAAASGLRQETASMSDEAILKAVGAVEPHPEGLFFPDTYQFAKGTSDLAVLRLAYASMQKQLAAAWQERAPGTPLKTPYQALILASIVEKETGRAEERALVSSVFLNRLRIGMLLQTDPTVIYGMGERFAGNIRKRDLLEDTPYNTYTRSGLPPTPIAMPGAASLRAAVAAPTTDALYFVSRGDGTSHFSRTLEEHNRAVTKYQRGGG
jgi:UPF0755 protein